MSEEQALKVFDGSGAGRGQSSAAVGASLTRGALCTLCTLCSFECKQGRRPAVRRSRNDLFLRASHSARSASAF